MNATIFSLMLLVLFSCEESKVSPALNTNPLVGTYTGTIVRQMAIATTETTMIIDNDSIRYTYNFHNEGVKTMKGKYIYDIDLDVVRFKMNGVVYEMTLDEATDVYTIEADKVILYDDGRKYFMKFTLIKQ